MRMDKLTHSLQAALGDAQSLAVGRDHPFIEPIHVLKAMLDPASSPTRALLRAAGAEHVVVSSADSFTDDLTAAITATGATLAFDAIGGGEQVDTLLASMEKASSAGQAFSRYGSDTHKQVYIYGGLDRSATTLRRTYGMSWGVGGWLLTPFLGRVGFERMAELQARVAAEITTTFASGYADTISLDDMLDPAVAMAYSAQATGEKRLVTP